MTKETLPDPDGSGPLTSPVVTIAYDNLSRKTSQTNALNETTTWAYGDTDTSQVTSMTLPVPAQGQSAPVWSYAYDSLGRRSQTTDPMTHVETLSFDADGNVLSDLDNLSHGETYTYGHGGERLTATDSLSHTTRYQYDSRYRLTQTTDANSGVTTITLDGVGNQTKLVDSVNNSTSWTFDGLNRPLTQINNEGTTTWTYNASSDVTSITDADGRVRDFNYDNLHRLTSEQWMNGNTVVATMSYAYDLASQLTSASDPTSAYAFAYDGDGNTLSVDNNGTPSVPHVVLTSAFDAGGERTSLSATIAGTADFLNNYTCDGDQRLTVVTQQDQTGGNIVSPKEIDYAYNALGQFTSVKAYNTLTGPRSDVLTGAYSYDTANRLTGLAYTSNSGATSIDTFGWGYDAANNVTSFSSIDGTATYGYDPTNQLTSATYTTANGGHQPANESYSFDKNGNRAMTGYTTGSDNLITSDGTFNYQHDADGNQTVRTRISNSYATDYETTYTWDYRNRLADVEYYDNNSVLTKHVHYVYDVFDHLIATEVDPNGGGTYTQTQRYVLDASPEIPAAGVPGTALGQPDLVFDGNGNLIQRNLVALDPAGVDAVLVQGTVASLTQGDTDTFVADDNLGTPRDAVNSSGTILDHRVFSAFGQDVYDSNPSFTFWAGFAGGHTDAITGLVNDYHRWFDPETGTWESPDPDHFSGGDANLHRYVGNNPISAVDRLGLYDPPVSAEEAAQNAADAIQHQLDQITLGNITAAEQAQLQGHMLLDFYQHIADKNAQDQRNKQILQELMQQIQHDENSYQHIYDMADQYNQVLKLEVKNEEDAGVIAMKLNVAQIGPIKVMLEVEKKIQALDGMLQMKHWKDDLEIHVNGTTGGQE